MQTPPRLRGSSTVREVIVRIARAAAPAAPALLLAACAAPGAEGPPPLDSQTRHELQLIECQQRAQNRPNEAQLLAECNHPRIGG